MQRRRERRLERGQRDVHPRRAASFSATCGFIKSCGFSSCANNCGGMRVAASAGSASCSAERSDSTDPPKTAAPIEPPIERRNCSADVATPTWRLSTAFCTARLKTGPLAPRPTPSTIIFATMAPYVVSTSIAASNHVDRGDRDADHGEHFVALGAAS